MTTVLWQSPWRPSFHPCHAVIPFIVLQRCFSVTRHRRALPLIQAVNFKPQRNMAANYKVLQWNSRDELMSEKFMKDYKIDTLRILPGQVEQELVKPEQGRKGLAKAAKAYGIMVQSARGSKVPGDTLPPLFHLEKRMERVARRTEEDLNDASAVDALEGLVEHPLFPPEEQLSKPRPQYLNSEKVNHALPKAVPYPDKEVVLKDTNLYEALKYIRPGYFLVPSEALPSRFGQLPDGRISSFDIYPVKQSKLTIVNIARFPLCHDHPLEHLKNRLDTIWTHFLKSVHVVAQISWKPKAKPCGYTYDWMWDNCVHLRPEIMQRALPTTSRLALGPLTNGNEITWLIAPTANPSNYEVRWEARQREQINLLKQGKGMLPKEERKRLKREMKEQLRLGKSKQTAGEVIFSPMTMAVARLSINRRIDDILSKYEKLVYKVKTYVGSRYGRDRWMNRGERETVFAVINLTGVARLKDNVPLYLPPRKSLATKQEREEQKIRHGVRGQPDYVWGEDYGQGVVLSPKRDSAPKTEYPSQRGYRGFQKNTEDKIAALKKKAQQNWEQDEQMDPFSHHTFARPRSEFDGSTPPSESAPIRYTPSESPSNVNGPVIKKHGVASFEIRRHYMRSTDNDDNVSLPATSKRDLANLETKEKPGEVQRKNWTNLEKLRERFPNKGKQSQFDLASRSPELDYKPRGASVDREFKNKYERGFSSSHSASSRILKDKDLPSNHQLKGKHQDHSGYQPRDDQPKPAYNAGPSNYSQTPTTHSGALSTLEGKPISDVSIKKSGGAPPEYRPHERKKDRDSLAYSTKRNKTMLRSFKLDFAVARAPPLSSGPLAES